MLDRKYVTPFQRMFAEQYDVIHRLETNKLRNVAKLFAHLLHTDAISWEVIAAFFVLLSRIALQSIRCSLLLQM